MKILLLIAGSRSGSDFFQSLLDSHSQILQFPGELRIDENFKKMLCYKEANLISKNL